MSRPSTPKWRKWLIISAISVVVLLGAGYIGLDLAVDYVLRSFVSDSGSDEQVKRALDGDLDAIFDEPLVEDEQATGTGPELDPTAVGVAADSEGSDDGISAVGVRETSTSGANATTGEDELSYTAEVTREKAEAVQESISLHEKLKVARVLLKRLDPSDVDIFLKMMSGGMTVAEKREAKDIMLERLSEEEYDELIEIAEKYGLSRGKTYEESLKE